MENFLILEKLHFDVMNFQLQQMYSCEVSGVFLSQERVKAAITVAI